LMHGILVLPLLAWQLSRSDWEERTRARAMWLGIAAYAFIVVGALLASVLWRVS
jgi:hypothetical protein